MDVTRRCILLQEIWPLASAGRGLVQHVGGWDRPASRMTRRSPPIMPFKERVQHPEHNSNLALIVEKYHADHLSSRQRGARRRQNRDPAPAIVSCSLRIDQLRETNSCPLAQQYIVGLRIDFHHV
jgi:hypothetical protein